MTSDVNLKIAHSIHYIVGNFFIYAIKRKFCKYSLFTCVYQKLSMCMLWFYLHLYGVKLHIIDNSELQCRFPEMHLGVEEFKTWCNAQMGMSVHLVQPLKSLKC